MDSINANVIQSLEARLLTEVILSFQEKDLDISAVHDCFLVHPSHTGKVKEAYVAALTKCLAGLTSQDFAGFFPEVKELKLNKLIENAWENAQNAANISQDQLLRKAYHALSS